MPSSPHHLPPRRRLRCRRAHKGDREQRHTLLAEAAAGFGIAPATPSHNQKAQLDHLDPLTPGDFATIIHWFRALTTTGTTNITLEDLIEALAGEVQLKPDHAATAVGLL